MCVHACVCTIRDSAIFLVFKLKKTQPNQRIMLSQHAYVSISQKKRKQMLDEGVGVL